MFRVRYPSITHGTMVVDYNEPKYLCLCRKGHVTKVATLIGLTGLILLCVQFVLGILGLLPISVFINTLLAWISAFSCLCLFYAERKRKPLLYVPFLIVEAIRLVALSIFEVIIAICWWKLVIGHEHAEEIDAACDGRHIFVLNVAPLARLGTLTVSFIFIGTMIAIFLLAWIYSVVWRAWCFMLHDLTYNLPFVKLPPATQCARCLFTLPSIVPPTLFRLRRFHSESSLNTYTCHNCGYITEYRWFFPEQHRVPTYRRIRGARQLSPLRRGSINAQNPSTSGSASTPQFIIIRGGPL